MRDLVLNERVVATERDVIIVERNSRTDNDPCALFQEQMREALYMNHPYGVPVIGWRHEIEALGLPEALTFYRRFYAPDNAILVVAGPMMTSRYRDERLGACTDCRRYWAQYRAGQIERAEIEQIETRLATTAGTCPVMGTASTMACIAEILGMTLPGTAAIPAVHADRLRAAEASGRRAADGHAACGGPPDRGPATVHRAVHGGTRGCRVWGRECLGRTGKGLCVADREVFYAVQPAGAEALGVAGQGDGGHVVSDRVEDEVDLQAGQVGAQAEVGAAAAEAEVRVGAAHDVELLRRTEDVLVVIR